MNRELFLTILEMDSYNRGYDRGVKFTPDESPEPRNEVSTSEPNLGLARVVAQTGVSEPSTDVQAGFYALAYNVSKVAGFAEGETVIAYRGTDKAAGRWRRGGALSRAGLR